MPCQTLSTPLCDVYDALLIKKVVDNLISRGSSKPKSVTSLQKALQPMTNVVTYNNISDVLNLYSHLENDPLRIPLETTIGQISIKDLTLKLMQQGKREAEKHNGFLIMQTSKQFGNYHARKTRRKKTYHNEPPTLQNVFDQFLEVIIGSDKVADAVIKNLQNCGIIKLNTANDEDNDSLVEYNLPSPFGVKCLKHLFKDFNEKFSTAKMVNDRYVQFEWGQKLEHLNREIRDLLLATIKDQFDSGETDEAVTLLVGNIQYAERSRRSDQRPGGTRRRRSYTRSPSSPATSDSSRDRSRSRERSRSHGDRSRSRSRSRDVCYSRSRSTKRRSRSRDESRSRSRSPLYRRSEGRRRESTVRRRRGRPSYRSRSRSYDSCSSSVGSLYRNVRSLSRSGSWLRTLDQKHAVRRIRRSTFWMRYPERSITFTKEDLKKLPEKIIAEAVPAIVALTQCGNEKPKRLSDLMDLIRSECRFCFCTSPLHLQGKRVLPRLFNLGKETRDTDCDTLSKVVVNFKMNREEKIFELNEGSIVELSRVTGAVTQEALNDRILKDVRKHAERQNATFILGLADSKMACYERLRSLTHELRRGKMATNETDHVKRLNGSYVLQRFIKLCTSRGKVAVEDLVDRLKTHGLIDVDTLGKITYHIDEEAIRGVNRRCEIAKNMMDPIKISRLPIPKTQKRAGRERGDK